MDAKNYIETRPMGIELSSMDIITKELSHLQVPEELADMIKRVIHTTADFEYGHLFEASDDAVENGINALKNGCKIYSDTTMIIAGTSKPALKQLNCSVECYVHDEEVMKESKEKNITRSILGVNKAAKDDAFKIYAIGNAPTALVRLIELYKEGVVKPDLVIGVPVGFVGAAESKEMLKESGLPHIIIRGRKGGSTVAVAILNALLYRFIKR